MKNIPIQTVILIETTTGYDVVFNNRPFCRIGIYAWGVRPKHPESDIEIRNALAQALNLPRNAFIIELVKPANSDHARTQTTNLTGGAN